MFRELTRKNRQISAEECVRVLQGELRGVLSVQGDDGYPYGVPMNFLYCEEEGTIFFHSGLTGHKVDAIRRCDKASFCVYDQGFRKEGEWALNIRSVIAFGRIRVLDNGEEAMEKCRRLCRKFTEDDGYIETEIAGYGAETLFFELIPEYMTGKMVNEA